MTISFTAALKRATSALASSEKEPQFSEDTCAADAKIKAIYRGMILAHAGYYLVMADLRSGDYQNYGFLPADEAELDTKTLLSHWSKERVARIWQSSNALNALSAEDKSSIAAFLNELKLFKPIYLSVKRTNPDFDALDQDAVDGILQKAGRPPINRCLISDYGYVLSWNVKGDGTRIDFSPALYMIGFWHRRDAQGTTDLADWFLISMSGWLSRS